MQGIFVYGFRTSMLSLPSLGYFLCNCQSVKCQSVKIEIVKLSRQSADKKVKKSSNKWECQSVKRESVKCQKNGFDSLTVGRAGRRGKKASRYVVFSEYTILFQRQLSKCQRVSKRGLTVNCKQIRHFRATVKLSRQSADKKVKKSSNKWECQSVKRESVKCQKNGFDSLTVGRAGRRGKKASRYVVFSEYTILFQRQLSKCQRVSKWGFDSKL